MQILKKKIFGIDFDIELDFWGPVYNVLQKIYEIKLWRAWQNENYLNPKLSFPFVKYALKHLPPQSFVIFSFDAKDAKFVQFANIRGGIHLDIPIWITNDFFDRKSDLKKILSTSGIKKADIKETKSGKEKLEIQVSFRNHYVKAAEIALLIAKDLFGITNPCVFDYKTSNFSQK